MTGASCDEGHPQIAPLKCFCAKCQKYLFYLNSNIVDAVIFFFKGRKESVFLLWRGCSELFASGLQYYCCCWVSMVVVVNSNTRPSFIVRSSSSRSRFSVCSSLRANWPRGRMTVLLHYVCTKHQGLHNVKYRHTPPLYQARLDYSHETSTSFLLDIITTKVCGLSLMEDLFPNQKSNEQQGKCRRTSSVVHCLSVSWEVDCWTFVRLTLKKGRVARNICAG